LTYEKASIHSDFAKKKLVPVIFCHGSPGDSWNCISTIWELVGNGCIVYSPNFSDGSAVAYKDEKGRMVTYFFLERDKRDLMLDWMMAEWISDIKEIITHIKNQKEYLLDLERLTIIGHSFGGYTSIWASYEFEDIKFCIGLDPVIWTRQDEIKAGTFLIK